MKQIFKTIDDYVIETANTINKTWNTTTGKTRLDLSIYSHILGGAANTLGSLYTYAEPVPIYQKALLNNPLLAIPLAFLATTTFITSSYLIQRGEERNKDKTTKDFLTYFLKINKRIGSYAFPLTAGFLALKGAYTDNQSAEHQQANTYAIVSMLSHGLGEIIMLAEDRPPQKNIIKKTLELLVTPFKQLAYQTTH
ncbi:MAG: hypothetical protein Q7R96_05375 [Nanoarchaeota archaeon]|nr:hypothetical protein [Nanoarchaeota archaeon]